MQTLHLHCWCSGELGSPCCPESMPCYPVSNAPLRNQFSPWWAMWHWRWHWPLRASLRAGSIGLSQSSTPMAQWLVQGKTCCSTRPNETLDETCWGFWEREASSFFLQEHRRPASSNKDVSSRMPLLKGEPNMARRSQCGTWKCSQHCTRQSRNTKGI